MAVSAKWYGQAFLGVFGAVASRRIDWVNDPIRVALVAATYVPDQDAHDFWNDVSANEVVGAGYIAGGKELGEKTLTYDAATNTVRLKAKTVEWTPVTVTARYAVIYKDTGDPATSPLLGYVDFGANEVAAAGLFKIEWDATDGVLRDILT